MINQSVQLIEENLHLVWNEKDAGKRAKAIERIYVNGANLYHVGEEVTGLDAINDSITTIQQNLPPDFVFTLLKPVVVNHDIGRAIWGAGTKDQPTLATGMDIVHIENGKIKTLYVFLES